MILDDNEQMFLSDEEERRLLEECAKEDSTRRGMARIRGISLSSFDQSGKMIYHGTKYS
jgi:hypothetical protein